MIVVEVEAEAEAEQEVAEVERLGGARGLEALEA